MSILFLLPGFPQSPVGGYQVVFEYANYLARTQRTEVRIAFSMAVYDRHNSQLSWPKLLCIRAISPLSILRRKLWHTKIPWFELDPAVECRETLGLPVPSLTGSDSVVATAIQTVPWAKRIADKTGATSVYFAQHYETWSAPKEFVDRAWAELDRVIVIAPWLVEIGRGLGLATTLVSNAVDGSQFPAGPELKSRDKRIIAMLSPQQFKRPDLTISVLENLHRRDPSIQEVTFGIAQRPSDLPKHIEYVRQPSRNRLAAMYRSARVYLCTSDWEGWHLPPAEALLSQTAVVSTAIPGVEAYASDAAFFAPVGDAHELAEQAWRVLQDPQAAQARTTEVSRALRAYTPANAAEAFATAILSR